MLNALFSRLPRFFILGLLVWAPLLSAQNLVKREPVSSLILSFAGDVYMSDEDNVRPGQDKTGSFLYQDLVPLLHGDDASFLDLNSPVTMQKTQRYPANANPVQVEAMVNSGFDVFSLANDHVTERGLAGVQESQVNWNNLWQRFPWIRFNGLKESASDGVRATIFTRKNKTLAFISLTYVPNSITQQKEAYGLVNAVDYENTTEWSNLLAYIKTLVSQTDLIIISCHGKDEDIGKQSWAQALYSLVDAGADIIWNHHRARYDQPVEFYKDRLIIHNNGTLLTDEVWDIKGNEEDFMMVAKGHSLLYRLSWYWYADKSQRFVVEAMPLSNYLHPQLGRLIIRSDDIRTLKSLPPVWRMYYERLLQGWSEDLNPGGEE